MLVYIADPSVFFTLRTNASSFPNLEALCGKRVAASRTSTWPGLIEKWSQENCTNAGKPAVTVVGTDSTPYARLALTQGRVDAAIQGQPALGYLNKLKGNPYSVIGPLLPLDYDAIAFSKKDQEFGQAVKQAIAELMADGTYQRLMEKWSIPATSAIPHPSINGQP